jgi:hypothetical protein
MVSCVFVTGGDAIAATALTFDNNNLGRSPISEINFD